MQFSRLKCLLPTSVLHRFLSVKCAFQALLGPSPAQKEQELLTLTGFPHYADFLDALRFGIKLICIK